MFKMDISSDEVLSAKVLMNENSPTGCADACEMNEFNKLVFEQHPLSKAFPGMSVVDFKSLVDSVKEIGVQNPITIFEGKVLDGWHRYRAAKQAGVSFPYVELYDIDPRQFVLAQNKVRRHITQSQLALATTAVYQWRSEGRPEKNPAPGTELRTVKELSEFSGVGKRMIERAKTVQSNACPEVIAAVKSGAIGLKKAEIISKLPMELQVEAIKKPIPNNRDPVGTDPVLRESTEVVLTDAVTLSEEAIAELMSENRRLNEVVESLQASDLDDEIRRYAEKASYYKNKFEGRTGTWLTDWEHHQLVLLKGFFEDIRKITGGNTFEEVISIVACMFENAA